MKFVSNNKGILTLDFIFATLIVFAFSAILFVFGFTLSIVEVVQYMTFSSARIYSLAHLDDNTRKQRAEAKFSELSENSTIKPLFKNGWFELGQLQLQDFNSDYEQPEDPRGDGDSSNFIGARVQLKAKVLAIKVPILGKTEGDGDSFVTAISSYVGPEPTLVDSRDNFAKQRFQQILNLDPTYSGGSVTPEAYVPIMDNGG